MKKQVFLTLFLICCSAVMQVNARTRQFILGADISWVDADIDRGQTFSDGGVEKSIFEILADHKFNLIRLRVFVDPSADVPGEQWDSPYSTQGYCGLERTIEFSKQIVEAGMLFSLDFHYSDTWADPSKQHKPMSWRDLSYEELVEEVRTYTRESLEAFEEAGVLPNMVQIGNEIVGGLIWPDGSTSNMSQFAELVNAGIDGVKDVSENIEIFIHSISDASPSSWLSNLIDAGVDEDRIDIYGLSYYEEWHGTTDDLERNLTSITEDHDVQIMVAEYAEVHERVNDIVYNLPDEEGIGTIVWEPTKWHDALFSGGRTNSNIDLYPELWEEYGNDTLPLIPETVSLQQGDLVSKRTASVTAWIDRNGRLRFGSIMPLGIRFELFTLQGRIAAMGSGDGTGVVTLKPVGSGSTGIQNGHYIIRASGENSFSAAVSSYR